MQTAKSEKQSRSLENFIKHEVKDAFLAALSHEIRTPLNSIIGFSNLIKQMNKEYELQEYIEILNSSAINLMQISDNILDFIRLEAGKFVLSLNEWEIKSLAHECIAAVRLMCGDRSIGISLHLAENLPQLILGDRDRVKQVIINLLSNAAKYTAVGTISLSIRRLSDEGNSTLLCFEVEDTGIGISIEDQKQIFEPFEPGNSVLRGRTGSGLGLAISQRLARLMGGELFFETVLGEGSRFWFEARFEIVSRIASIDTSRSSSVSTPGRCLEILLAEDTPASRRLVSALLTKRGHKVFEVENGIEAVEAVMRKPFDLVLMDIEMPQMDGLTATRSIRALGGPHAMVPIVAITAQAYSEQRIAAIQSGMNNVLVKPLRIEALETVLCCYGAEGHWNGT